MSIGDRVLLQLPEEAVGAATGERRAGSCTRAGRDCRETRVVGTVGPLGGHVPAEVSVGEG